MTVYCVDNQGFPKKNHSDSKITLLGRHETVIKELQRPRVQGSIPVRSNLFTEFILLYTMIYFRENSTDFTNKVG